MPRREIPKIVVNYLRLIRERQFPYYLIAKRLVDDMEAYYKPRSPAEVIYTLNPKWLYNELNTDTKHEKLTIKNVSRTVRAFLTDKELEYYTTTAAGGRSSYHVALNPQVAKRLTIAELVTEKNRNRTM
jgi:hypothetical protein